MNKFLFFLIILLFFAGLVLYFNPNLSRKYKEAFTGIEAGTYPLSIDKAILSNYYQEKNNPTLSFLNYKRMSESYPIYSSDHIGSNNLRYWPLPNNGRCTYPELCDAIYNPLSCSQQENTNYIDIINNPSCSLEHPRVNVWCSKNIIDEQ